MHLTSSASCCRALLAASALAVLAGCASTAVDAQWRNVELQPAYLRGARVLVNCETSDLVLRRICEDDLSADLAARGAVPVLAAPGTMPAPQQGTADAQYLPTARDSGATAIFSVTLGLASQAVSQGVSVGIGGFGFGRYSGGGVGVSAPIGGGAVTNGYAADSRITDVASGRLMWAARASAPPSSDINTQLAELSKSVVNAAGKAGLF